MAAISASLSSPLRADEEPDAWAADAWTAATARAREILATWTTADAGGRRALAGALVPDPWLVVEALLGLGHAPLAEGFADAAEGQDVDRLPAHVRARRDQPDNARGHDLLGPASPGGGVPPDPLGSADLTPIAALVLAQRRALALEEAGDRTQAAEAWGRAAGAAEEIGWWRVAAAAYREEARSRLSVGDAAGVVRTTAGILRVAQARGRDAEGASDVVNLGVRLFDAGRVEESLSCYTAGLSTAERAGHLEWTTNALLNCMVAAHVLRRHAMAWDLAPRVLEAARRLGKRETLLHALDAASSVALDVYRPADAVEILEEALRLAGDGKDARLLVVLLNRLGIAHARRGDVVAAVAASRRAAEALPHVEDPALEALVWRNHADYLVLAERHADALAAWQSMLRAAREAKDAAREADALTGIGIAATALGDVALAASSHEGAVGIREVRGPRTALAGALVNLGAARRAQGRLEEAVALGRRGIEEALRSGSWIAEAHTNLAESYRDLGLRDEERQALLAGTARLGEDGADPRGRAALETGLGLWEKRNGSALEAVAALRRARALYAALSDRRGIGGSFVNEGDVHRDRTRWEEARAAYEAGIVELDAAGYVPWIERGLLGLAVAYEALGAPQAAGRATERLIALRRRAGAPGPLAAALAGRARQLALAGEREAAAVHADEALALVEKSGTWGERAHVLETIALGRDPATPAGQALWARALAIRQEAGDRAGMAQAHSNLATHHDQLGRHGLVLEALQEEVRLREDLGESPKLVEALGRLAFAYGRLGDLHREAELLTRVIDVQRRTGPLEDLAQSLTLLAGSRAEAGEADAARVHLAEAEAALARFPDVPELAGACVNVGVGWAGLGDSTQAAAWYRRGLALAERSGRSDWLANALGNLAEEELTLGDFDAAREHFVRSVELKEEAGDDWGLVRTLAGLASLETTVGRPGEAIRLLRRALTAKERAEQGQASEHAASVRQELARFIEEGVRAALALESAEDLLLFLESGRAGSLLEELGGRAALPEGTLPPELAAAEDAARVRQAEARVALRRARGEGDRREIRRAERDRAEADRAMEEVVATIQRQGKAAAEVFYPRAASIPELQGALAPDEALVLYAFAPTEAAALVVEPSLVRIVGLGERRRLQEAQDAALPGAPPWVVPERLGSLRRILVDALEFGPAVRQVLVSPDGPLAFVPFSSLLRDREHVLVPSGTAWLWLRRERTKRGSGVLALGDPVYASATAAPATLAYRGGRELLRLPATADEARAVGDVLLLAEEATEGHLRRALAGRPRWRAVHLACHGLLRPDRPVLSSLALTPGGGDDGYLSVADVLRLSVPADLVVLSACETGLGKVFRGEGSFGLPRAFMVAGPPSVLCSLWEVEDQATRALMVRFYDLWNPKDGRPGLGAAAALRAAQDHVRAQEAWRHPSYWAGWTLWGLP